MIESVVVKTAEPFPPRIVRPHPFLEPFLDAHLLLAGGLGRLGVHDRFLVLIEVVDRGRLEVKGILDEFERRVTVCAPIGRVGGRSPGFPIPREMPSAERVDVSDLHARRNVEQLLREAPPDLSSLSPVESERGLSEALRRRGGRQARGTASNSRGSVRSDGRASLNPDRRVYAADAQLDDLEPAPTRRAIRPDFDRATCS